MTPKTKKIIIGTSIGVITLSVGYLIYKRAVNKKNSALMLEYINSLLKENTTEAKNTIANQQVASAQSKTMNEDNVLNILKQYKKVKPVAFDGKLYDLAKKDQRDMALKKAADIAIELYLSMNGLGTNIDKFQKSFSRINSNGAFILVNGLYKGLYKGDLWKAIEGEESLYKGAGNGWNVTLGNFVSLPDYHKSISDTVKYWKF